MYPWITLWQVNVSNYLLAGAQFVGLTCTRTNLQSLQHPRRLKTSSGFGIIGVGETWARYLSNFGVTINIRYISISVPIAPAYHIRIQYWHIIIITHLFHQLLEFGSVMLGGLIASHSSQHPQDHQHSEIIMLSLSLKSGKLRMENAPRWEVNVAVKVAVRLTKAPFVMCEGIAGEFKFADSILCFTYYLKFRKCEFGLHNLNSRYLKISIFAH